MDDSNPLSVSRRTFFFSHHNCTPPAIEQFPTGLFTLEQRQHGALVIHFVITLYVLCALAVVCHEYFVPAIERVISVFKLESDVTGAAIMATAASTPQLATSVVGVFIAKSDIGVGAVVGSSYFNIFFIMGLCAICSKEPLRLSWWPVFRDVFFYLISATLLVILLSNQKALWSDGFCLLIAYIVYVIILIFNARVEHAFTYCLQAMRMGFARCRCKNCKIARDDSACEGCGLVNNLKINQGTQIEKVPFNDSEKERTYHTEYSALSDSAVVEAGSAAKEGNSQYMEATAPTKENCTHSGSSSENQQEVVDGEVEEYRSILHFPKTTWRRVLWVVLLPALGVIFVVIPDCRRPKAWKYLFVITILMSVVFIGLSAYILVWMVAIIGSTIGIPDTIMGLTFLAAGASIPDLMNAVLVSRLGYGDMAVSNCIGSNIFDILVCLGLPWFLDVIFERHGTPILIYDDISSISICLIVSGLIVFTCLFITNWRMNKILGWVFTVAYLGFITFTAVFDNHSTLPACPTSV